MGWWGGSSPEPCADPLWELSSSSEAAKAVGQATEVSPVPPSSQASQLPHWTAPGIVDISSLCFELSTPAPTCKPNPLWELSSFSEAAKAVGQATEVSPVPPSSQASQLPHFERCTPAPACKPNPCGSCRALARLRKRWVWQLRCRLCRRLRRQASSHILNGVHLHPPANPIPCGSCRALARLRKRWVRRQRFRLCHRYRRQTSSHT